MSFDYLIKVALRLRIAVSKSFKIELVVLIAVDKY
jgi:hypothetical protein